MTNTTAMRDKRLKLAGALLLGFTVVVIYIYNRNTTTYPCTEDFFSIPELYIQDEAPLKASNLMLPKNPSNWYADNCFKDSKLFGRSAADVYNKLNVLRASTIKACKEISDLFDMMFSFEENIAPLTLPEPFKSQVLKWLNNSAQLFDQIPHQKVYKIINKFTFEESVYNPLRSKRPTSKTDINPVEYINNLSSITKQTCDFCSYKDHTATDIFGRVDNQFSASASNTFKLSKFHGLFFPKAHHPLGINHTVLSDIFLNTSQQWFQKAYETDTKQIYPSLLWDSLPHAGASQVHPHLHGLMGEHQYAGLMESLHSVAERYYHIYKRSYWTDYVLLHSALGLAVQKSQAILIVPVNARKDHEYMILSSSVNEDAVMLLYKVIEGFKNNLGVYCWSGGGAYPAMDKNKSGLPMIFRISSRGVCTSVSSDVSSLELYTVNNINTDLEKTFLSVRNTPDL